MAIFDDEEVLHDFLVEAGELLEKLSVQLVELEQRPSDTALLKDIFRGFHTVKGSAGFLQLDPMVVYCHHTESLFDRLRSGEMVVTGDLMDVVLRVLDVISQQYQQVSHRIFPDPPNDTLVNQLAGLYQVHSALDGDDVEVSMTDGAYTHLVKNATVSASVEPPKKIPPDNVSESLSEFNAPSPEPLKPSPASLKKDTLSHEGELYESRDEMTQDEFEALLDDIHGKGKAPTGSATAAKSSPQEATLSSDNGLSDRSSLAEVSPSSAEANAQVTASDSPSPEAAQQNPSHKPSHTTRHGPNEGNDLDDIIDALYGDGGHSDNLSSGSLSQNGVSPDNLSSGHMPSGVEAYSGEVSNDTVVSIDSQKANQTLASASLAQETTVRVDTQRLDDIMNMVGELVLVRNRLVRLGVESQNGAVQKAVANLDVVTADLQSAVMKTRMQPIKKVFSRFPRVARDLARSLDKDVVLEMQGEETDLDKNLVDALADPLVHLVRNAVDHGIESPGERESKGKPRAGQIILAAEQEGDHILLSITDDGCGMSVEKILQKAIHQGVVDSDNAARLSEQEIFNLIFTPGFSTKESVSNVSGRGVGMDVVKTKISQLNGSVQVDSSPGEGTRIMIKVPLTLAIMPTLMIMLGNQTFALPLVSVNEIFHMDLKKSHVVDGQECITIRDKAIPMFHLKRWLVKHQHLTGGDTPDEGHVVIVTVGTQRVGFVVDQLIGQEEVVIKPLGKMLHGTPGMAGATITGDGTMALILDVPSMLKRYAG